MEIEYDHSETSMEIESSHLLSDQVKWAIVHFKLQDYSNKKTAQVYGEMYDIETSSHQTVKSIWDKYLKNQSIENE